MQQGVRVDAVEVGRRVRRLREALGLSQRELQVDGVSYAYISRIESGTRVPSLQALVALGRELGVTAEFLVNGRRKPSTCAYCGRPHRRRGGGADAEPDEDAAPAARLATGSGEA